MGIECAAFIDPVDDELCCAICTDVFDAPVVACKELHTFCGECLNDVRKSPNHFPTRGAHPAVSRSQILAPQTGRWPT
jgi:hypothetical protein